MSNFKAYSQYYDLLYSDKDYAGEAVYIKNLLSRYKSGGITQLLELGCGSGNHAQYLSGNGLGITGIERSKEMVTLADSKSIEGFTPLEGDITNFSLTTEFDAALALFHVISYLHDNDSLLSCFKSTHRHLKPGGLFIFDVWYSPAVLTQLPETRIKRLADDKIEVTRLAQPKIDYTSNIVEVHYEIWVRDKMDGTLTVFNEVHPMRHFSVPEIELIAWLTGFKILKCEEFLTSNTPDNNSWGVCFIMEKDAK